MNIWFQFDLLMIHDKGGKILEVFSNLALILLVFVLAIAEVTNVRAPLVETYVIFTCPSYLLNWLQL